jgi:hypothetical protein
MMELDMTAYNKARGYLNEVAPEIFGWIIHNIRIWDEDIHGALTGHNIAHLIHKNHEELHVLGIGAPFWRAVEVVADREIFLSSRPVESLTGALMGFDHYLIGG